MRHAELTRVANAQPSAQLDLTRYRMDEPAADAPLPEWLAAVDNARAQLEHQRLRHLNLQLLAKFGVPSWQAHTAELESMLRKVEEETAELRARVVEVNRQRKMEQKAAGGKLRELEDRWVELVNQSLQVELACTQLERRMRERGVHSYVKCAAHAIASLTQNLEANKVHLHFTNHD